MIRNREGLGIMATENKLGLSQDSRDLLKLKVLMGTVTEKEKVQFEVLANELWAQGEMSEDYDFLTMTMDEMTISELLEFAVVLRLREENIFGTSLKTVIRKIKQVANNPIPELQRIETINPILHEHQIFESHLKRIANATNTPLEPLLTYKVKQYQSGEE